jgi:SAM-dependent methyltransferase
MLIRKSVLQKTGTFDEVFFAYMEEIDLCWRIHLQGFRVIYVPTSLVYHIGGYSLDQRVLKRMYLNHRNSMIMLLKNYSLRRLLPLLPIKIVLEVGIMAAALLRNPRRSLAVLMSFGWILTHIPTIVRLRAPVQASRRVPDAEIRDRLYSGMAPVWYFLFGIHQAIDLPDIDRVLHQPYRAACHMRASGTVFPDRRDFLNAYLDQAPVPLALMRALECEHLSRFPFERPILDLGCGDGTFARVLFNGVVMDAGIDADEREVRRARRTRCYSQLLSGRIEQLPFDDESFTTVYSNCVLEHVREIEGSMREIHRVLRPGGTLYMTVPSPRCVTFRLWPRLLTRLRLHRLASGCATITLRLFKATHVMEAHQWIGLLARVGLIVQHHEPYMSLRATRIQDLFLPTAFASLFAKRVLGRNLIFPRLHRLKVRAYRCFLRSAYQERTTHGSGIVLVARKLPA